MESKAAKQQAQVVAPSSKKQSQDKKEKKRRPSCIQVKSESEAKQLKIIESQPEHHKTWRRRLRLTFCAAGPKRNKDSFSDVAAIFANFFGDMNVTTSKMTAGFSLLAKFQKAQIDYINRMRPNGIQCILSNVPIRKETQFVNLAKAEDSHLFNDLIYYMDYSLAIFGWALQMIDEPCQLCCIFPHISWRSCFPCFQRNRRTTSKVVDNQPTAQNEQQEQPNRYTSRDSAQKSTRNESNDEKNKEKISKKQMREALMNEMLDDNDLRPIIEEDNCCRCNWASAEKRLETHHFEVIYISYHSDVCKTPFLVAADHAKATIVVSIRGSMNLSDAVTDLRGVPDALEGYPSDWLAHRGMLSAANYVKNRLIQERILDRAFNCHPDWNSQNYQLLLCGHSLGAGVAAILGILLKPIYPNLKAYLYSPPGGILSMPAVEYTKEFATGVILGNDCIARLGHVQLERLRYQSALAFKSADQRVRKVLAKSFCPSCCSGENEVEYDPENSFDLMFAKTGHPIDYQGFQIPFESSKILYVPGRLIHIVRNDLARPRRSSVSEKKNTQWPIYQAIWSADNSIYDRIIICDNMFLDHVPFYLIEAMKMLSIRTIPDRRKPTNTETRPDVQPQQASLTNSASSTSKYTSEVEREETYLTASDSLEKFKSRSNELKSETNEDNTMYPILKQSEQAGPAIGFVRSKSSR